MILLDVVAGNFVVFVVATDAVDVDVDVVVVVGVVRSFAFCNPNLCFASFSIYNLRPLTF